MRRIASFIAIFNLYRKAHPMRYAARIAFGVAFRSLPF